MLTVAGIGPGNTKYLTAQVVEAINSAECIVAFGRAGESIKALRSDYIKVKNVDEVYRYSLMKENVLILASGDPCFYGILEYLKNKDILVDEVFPGLSSFQYMMGKLKKSWHNSRFLSLHGRDESLEVAFNSPMTIILTDSTNTPRVISKKLHELGLRGSMYIGYNLSYKDECILKINIGEEIEDISSLAVVVVENEMD
ncbi:precorrin-6y C5,15-methyltransferase (decarboxylating) subunit CbiE [Sporanaerobacter acetigenes]|uniref:Precorrin-6Y C5,15-methyltransferase (Decarboxylating) n=1 Tax=Sporanaerobacter acetigenes DSM 13106 TaxID=1123281 RepID=A0A1M5Y436_9FIRM|nr:precorrin-6y C5,15-methyltransferase (decarboxylating) subunit CbiE [Sporanaerobacter acetigenes]SHI06807.1 precorrin-6Y C5,15-methyltransferase (decarboxylating) [Sporanaerobacter acetigenes DSM 13106]